jgi:hypothetical protein
MSQVCSKFRAVPLRSPLLTRYVHDTLRARSGRGVRDVTVGSALGSPLRVPRSWKKASKIRHGMAISVIEGLVAAAMLGFIESFIVPILQTRLHATPAQIGLLSIIPMIGTTLLCMRLSPIIRWLGGNKKSVLIHTYVQITCLMGLSIPLYFPHESWAVPCGLACAITISLAGAVGGSAWTSWMGGLVPRTLQSRYLAFRTRLLILVKLSFAGIFAGILHFLPAEAGPWGLQILIIIAVLSRIFSAWLLALQYEPPARRQLEQCTNDQNTHHVEGGFTAFIRSLIHTDFGRWTLVWAVLHFGVMIAGPYFAVFMLSPDPRGLGLSPGWIYVLLVQSAVIVRMLSYPVVGHLIDLFGPSAILRFAVCGIMLVPVMWAFTNTIPLLLLTEVISGFCWCAAEVAVGVLLFTCHDDPMQRSRLIGYHQALVTAMAACGAAVGSFLLSSSSENPGEPWLPAIFGSAFHTLFLISAVMRLPAVLLAIRFLPALRRLEKHEWVGIWRRVPGTSIAHSLSRGVLAFFRRPDV